MSKIFITQPILPELAEFSKQLEVIWENKWLTNNGKFHRELETALKKYLKIDNLSLFCNGTIALLITLKALNLTGEIITTPFTFPATITVLEWIGLKPVFCDINEDTMCIDANKIEAQITEKTAAILPVHVYGIACDTEKIQSIANKYGLKVIYDGAHIFTNKHSQIYNAGDATMLSFHATKVFHTIEGGAIITKDPALKEKIDLLKNFGIEDEDVVSAPGINGKINEFQSLMGLLNLKIIDKEIFKRKNIKHIYDSRFKNVNGIITYSNKMLTDYYYPIRIIKEKFGLSRDEIYKLLLDEGIKTRKYFYPLCSNYPFFKSLPSAEKENLSVANEIAKQILCLPLYGDLPPDISQRICDIILLSLDMA